MIPMHTDDCQIAITGTGICSAIGSSPESVVKNLVNGVSGLASYAGDGKEQMISRFAAIHHQFELDQAFDPRLAQWWDRATQMAATAASNAVESSGIRRDTFDPYRIGLATGVSGAGQFTPDRSVKLDDANINKEVAELLCRRNVPHFQLYQLARLLGVAGPTTCLSSASAGSGIAIGNALRWLLGRQADVVIAGGGEAVMLLNFLGFDTLGLLSPNRCSPFSKCEGMNMGEGAAFVVLERLQDALDRGAEIRGVLHGFGVSSDAFDPILFDPSGDGIRRAMEIAIHDSHLQPKDIGWIRASGAGGMDQDASEVMAIQSLFESDLPLVSSTEANFGHCNGAGPAIGLVAAVESQRIGMIPPTIHFENQTFDSIDFVPNQARSQVVDRYLSSTAAFGGTNVVLVGGKPNARSVKADFDEIVISGMSVVSKHGCANSDFASLIGSTKTFIQSIDRKNVAIEDVHEAGLVGGFSFRREAPSIPSRGLDLLTQYAAVAAKRALGEAESNGLKFESNRLGVVTGIAKTSGILLEKLFEEIRGPWATPAVGRALLNKGRFLVTSRLAHWLNCKGYNATHSHGIGCGLIALNQTFEQLRQSDSMDAAIVVAADEVSRIGLSVSSKLGWLAKDGQCMAGYSHESSGMKLGEGAVAFVLERRSSVEQRGGKILAKLASVSSSLDPIALQSSFESGIGPNFQMNSSGDGLERAIQNCFEARGMSTSQLDLVLGSSIGIPEIDLREKSVIDRTISTHVAYGSANAMTGVMYSTSSLFNMALAVAAMNDPHAVSVLNQSILLPGRSLLNGLLNNAAVLATSEDGHNSVALLQRYS